MIKINYTSQFKKSLKKIPRLQVERFVEKELLFRANPFDPSLKTHKFKGKLKDFWSFSICHEYRILFVFEDEVNVTFVDIGTHGIYS